jgi:hypothetical protein
MWGLAARIASLSESFPAGHAGRFFNRLCPHDYRIGQIDSTLPGVTAALQQRDGFISNIGGVVGVICGIPNQVNMPGPIAATRCHG